MNEPCDCCEGTERVTPEMTANRPGLDTLHYRVGRHATFLETMKAVLNGIPGLQTRRANDPSIALLDAWGTVADVLTFYQERIANEGYLRTATERRSVLELARLVGYRLRPGVAASVYLAFLMENNTEGIIPVGTRAQSLPGPSETPQSFETSEQITARAVWNQMRPRASRPQWILKEIVEAKRFLYFKGTNTGLQPNMPILIDYGEGSRTLYRVTWVAADQAVGRTRVEFEKWTPVTAASTSGNPSTEVPPPSPGAALLNEWYDVAKNYPDQFNLLRPEEPLIEYRVAFEKNRNNLYEMAKIDTTVPLGEQSKRSTQREQIVRQLITLLQIMEIRLAALGIVQANDILQAYREDLKDRVKAAFEAALTAFERIPTSQDSGMSHEELAVLGQLRSEFEQLKKWLIALGFGQATEFQLWRDSAEAKLSGWERGIIVGQTFAGIVPTLMTGPALVGLPGMLPILPNLLISFQPSGGFVDLWRWLRPGLFVPPQPPIALPRSPADRIQQPGELLNKKGDAVLKTIAAFNPLTGKQVYTALGGTPSIAVSPARVYAFRVKAPLFGHNTLKGSDVRPRLTNAELDDAKTDWKLVDDDKQANVLWLDTTYDKIRQGSPIVILKDNGTPIITTVVGVQEATRSNYRLSVKSSRIQVESGWEAELFSDLRTTTVYAQAEALELAEMPVVNALTSDSVELNTVMDGLELGRWMIVAGERIDAGAARGVRDAELVMVGKVEHGVDDLLPGDRAVTRIQFVNVLKFRYKQDTVVIYGNVAKATHGETRTEVLGSGDGAQSFQSFKLKQSPVTYLAAAIPEGALSTLEIRVNNLLWRETNNLAAQEPSDREYTTHSDDEDKTTVIFGDGEHGVRPPTGVENLRAKYRTGIGKPGNVGAGKITLLATRPLDVQSVINPLRASGGADRENRDQARKNAPLATTTLGRIVSVKDYADFARTFAGIGKAHAVRLVTGAHTLVYLTIAGADDIPIDYTSDLYLNLVEALRRYGDPYQAVQVAVRDLLALVISANVRILPDYEWEKVKEQIQRRLLDRFSFERRDLGQDVTRSEVISTIQAVPGVGYVDLDKLDRLENFEEAMDSALMEERQAAVAGLALRGRIVADVPRIGRIAPAQIVYLRPDLPETLAINRITP